MSILQLAADLDKLNQLNEERSKKRAEAKASLKLEEEKHHLRERDKLAQQAFVEQQNEIISDIDQEVAEDYENVGREAIYVLCEVLPDTSPAIMELEKISPVQNAVEEIRKVKAHSLAALRKMNVAEGDIEKVGVLETLALAEVGILNLGFLKVQKAEKQEQDITTSLMDLETSLKLFAHYAPECESALHSGKAPTRPGIDVTAMAESAHRIRGLFESKDERADPKELELARAELLKMHGNIRKEAALYECVMEKLVDDCLRLSIEEVKNASLGTYADLLTRDLKRIPPNILFSKECCAEVLAFRPHIPHRGALCRPHAN